MRKGWFLSVLIVLVAMWLCLPLYRSTTSVKAEGQETAVGATEAMLDYALNLRAASGLAVYGGSGVTASGSEFRGAVASDGNMAGVASNVLSKTDTAAVRRDLTDTLGIVGQLPCTQVGGELSEQIFTPGIYCIGSARLAGRMTVDAGGKDNARFVFRVSGDLWAEDAARIAIEGGAKATNVYIFLEGSASIGANANIGANVIARGAVGVGRGSTVSGKVISIEKTVTSESNVIAAGTGYIEICKSIYTVRNPFVGDIAPGTIFDFTVSGIDGTVKVPAGACSPPIQVAAGSVTVTEQPQADIAVASITAAPAGRLTSFDLALRKAVITVPDGDIADETVVTFTNQPTRTGTIEICKDALDIDVSGFFRFTVQGAPGHTFVVPVGFCSGPITLTIPQTGGPFTANVTELAEPNFRLENVTTFPITALNGTFTANAGFDANGVALADNTNGGFANISLNTAGGAANQTTVRFYNRSLPGRIKVCKITAQPAAIPVGTLFTFELSGLAPTSPTQTMPGTAVTTNVNVPAGPASQGGFCTFAPGTWIVGQPVTIKEIGLAPGQMLP